MIGRVVRAGKGAVVVRADVPEHVSDVMVGWGDWWHAARIIGRGRIIRFDFDGAGEEVRLSWPTVTIDVEPDERWLTADAVGFREATALEVTWD